MKRRHLFALGALAWSWPSWSAADSPLTSTDLAESYLDLPAVRQARDSHRVAGEVLQFLVASTRTDQKATVVNALAGRPAATRWLS